MPTSATKATNTKQGGSNQAAHKQLSLQRLPLPSIAALPDIQASLQISSPNDRYEQEADTIARQIMWMPMVSAPTIGISHLSNQAVQRMCAACRHATEVQEETLLQTKGTGSAQRIVQPQRLLHAISSLRGRGRGLNPTEKNYYEPRFGRDFSHVRLHDGARAADIADAVRARAFTVGNHIVFNRGELSMSSNAGRQLLAHELTHVVQQRGARQRISRDIQTKNLAE